MDPLENEKFHTSLSIQKKHLLILQKHAAQYNVSVNDLIILLLRIAIRNKGRIISKNQRQRIQYQKAGSSYKIVNLYLAQRDYEVFITARRFFKVSVSWLLGYAIENFIKEVLAKILVSLENGIEILNNYINLHVYIRKNNGKKNRFRAIIRPFT